MNVKLLRKVQKAILAHPDQFSMYEWFPPYLDNGAIAGGCGTAACVAGWAVHCKRRGKTLKKTKELTRKKNINSAAQKALGLTDLQASSLFHLDNWPIRFQERWDACLKANRTIVDVACQRIDHFIATKGAE